MAHTPRHAGEETKRFPLGDGYVARHRADATHRSIDTWQIPNKVKLTTLAAVGALAFAGCGSEAAPSNSPSQTTTNRPTATATATPGESVGPTVETDIGSTESNLYREVDPESPFAAELTHRYDPDTSQQLFYDTFYIQHRDDLTIGDLKAHVAQTLADAQEIGMENGLRPAPELYDEAANDDEIAQRLLSQKVIPAFERLLSENATPSAEELANRISRRYNADGIITVMARNAGTENVFKATIENFPETSADDAEIVPQENAAQVAFEVTEKYNDNFSDAQDAIAAVFPGYANMYDDPNFADAGRLLVTVQLNAATGNWEITKIDSLS